MAEAGGYGLSAVAYIRALRQAGVPVRWQPMVWSDGTYRPARDADQALRRLTVLSEQADLRAMFHAPVEYDTVVVHMTPEFWPDAREDGKRMVGYTVWETDRLPLHWPPLLNGYDLILTPSTFSRAVFTPHTDIPVAVLPHLPRTDWPQADTAARAAFRRRFAVNEDDFMFYTINSWILRKATWLTLHAFLLAFAQSERAVLLLKTGQEGEVDDKGMHPTRRLFDSILANYPDPARVVFVGDELSERDIGLLHISGDAYLSLTRSEGFAMGAFDAASAGNPVIITGWSGQLDILARQHACLVKYELQQVHEHLGNHMPQKQHWAHAKLDDAIRWMRRLYENPEEARARGAGLKKYISEQFNPHHITQKLLKALNA